MDSPNLRLLALQPDRLSLVPYMFLSLHPHDRVPIPCHVDQRVVPRFVLRDKLDNPFSRIGICEEVPVCLVEELLTSLQNRAPLAPSKIVGDYELYPGLE